MFTTFFYRLPRLTVLVILVILAGGLGAILTLGRQEDPTLTERFGYVLTEFPGADAERVVALVTSDRNPHGSAAIYHRAGSHGQRRFYGHTKHSAVLSKIHVRSLSRSERNASLCSLAKKSRNIFDSASDGLRDKQARKTASTRWGSEKNGASSDEIKPLCPSPVATSISGPFISPNT